MKIKDYLNEGRTVLKNKNLGMEVEVEQFGTMWTVLVFVEDENDPIERYGFKTRQEAMKKAKQLVK